MQGFAEMGSPQAIGTINASGGYSSGKLLCEYMSTMCACKNVCVDPWKCVFVCMCLEQDSWGRCLSSGWGRAALNHSSTDTPHNRVSRHVLVLRERKGGRGGGRPTGSGYWVTEREREINLSINQHIVI